MKKNAFVKDFEDELRLFPENENNIIRIEEDLEYIDNKVYDIKKFSPSLNSVFKGSCTNDSEERLLNLFAKSDRLKKQLLILKQENERINEKLSCLSEEEMKLIELRYFRKYSLEKIGRTIFKDKGNISRDIDKILLKVLEHRYGKII